LKKLKIILQCNYLYYILLIISIFYSFIILNSNVKSLYSINDNEVYGYVKNYVIDKEKITITLKAKEKILVKYYYKDKKEIKNISYGDYIYVNGLFIKPNNNTNFNIFNYRKYLLSKKIKYIVNSNSITIINKNKSFLYKLKNTINKRINKMYKTKGYLMMFLFADKNYISEDTYLNYQKLGISHLFAVSGMHISFTVMLLLKILYRLNDRKKYTIIIIFLLYYLFLTDFTISMMRACFQFILLSINKLYKLKINKINILILLFSIFLLNNPFYIYNVGFIFSFLISFSLLLFNNIINKGSYIKKIIKTSLISFLVSIPVLINNFYQINILSVVFNVFYIPFVTFVLFPFSILTILFPFLDYINYKIIFIFENISNLLSNVDLFSISIAKLPLIIIIIYYLLLYRMLKSTNNKNIIKFIFMLVIILFYKSFLFNPRFIYLDVKQGDSSLLRINNKNLLIDTGGIVNYNNKPYNLTKYLLVPYLKSEGVKRINYLILTHGDFDHMGEAINLINNFKVEKVIFNCGPYNDLEKELIKVLDEKKIKYYSCIKELDIDNNKLYFLQTKEYDNENDNSNVIYTELNGYKFMFMGDASVTTEKGMLNKYNLPDIDVLKVGHHGSKTSSGKEFINEINPKYSIISVGKNNRYGHPNKEVLDNLKKSRIYRTDEDGSIMFKIKNNKLQIETCSP